MYAPYTRADLVSPFAGPRSITALLRFEVVPGDGKYLIANHGQPHSSPRCAAQGHRLVCAWL